jgi:hypothetical protein
MRIAARLKRGKNRNPNFFHVSWAEATALPLRAKISLLKDTDMNGALHV